MRKRRVLLALSAVCAILRGADWPTDGGNPQRTAWQQDEKILNKNNVKNLKILWKIKLDNKPQEMHSLFPPLILEKVATSAGERTLATSGAEVVTLAPDWKDRFLAIITEPSVALILMMLGVYGIFFEFTNPGFVLPGVIGGISLLGRQPPAVFQEAVGAFSSTATSEKPSPSVAGYQLSL